jgi:hypothetical protein
LFAIFLFLSAIVLAGFVLRIFAKLFPNKYAYSMQERKNEVTFTKGVNKSHQSKMDGECN